MDLRRQLRPLSLLAGLGLVLVLGIALGRSHVARAQATLHTLTESDNNTQITVPVGDSIELKLPTDLDWNVQITNYGVLTRPPVALARDVQGLWKASMPGESVITADGKPQCSAGAVCAQYIVHFQATVDVTSAGAPNGPSSGGQTAAYAAGWNLIAAPSGTDLSAAAPPLYTLQPGQTSYATVQPSTGTATGIGYWAYFADPTNVALAPGSGTAFTVNDPAGQFIMVGDPSGSLPATVSGADAVYTYTLAGGYVQSTQLMPGQGAWVWSQSGGAISVTPQQETPTATASPTPQPAAGVQQCGSVNSLGGHVTNSGALEAENCFTQAYLTCSPATLTATINGVDAGTTHMFSIQNNNGACTITDVAQTRVIPRPAGPQMTYTCTGLSQASSGLVFSSCGNEGDVTVPAPSGS